MTAQRQFQRIKFAVETDVDINGARHDATLVDISLRGALVAFQDELPLTEGLPCQLSVHLDQSSVVLFFAGEIVRSRANLAGIKFTTINIDSMIHLRRLLELNTADPDQVKSELKSFIGAD
jgi:PilZ domain-containing protein